MGILMGICETVLGGYSGIYIYIREYDLGVVPENWAGSIPKFMAVK